MFLHKGSLLITLKMREEAPVFLHPPFLNDPEPGFWSLTRHEDILKVSSNPKIFSSQAGTGTMITLGSEEEDTLSCGDLPLITC